MQTQTHTSRGKNTSPVSDMLLLRRQHRFPREHICSLSTHTHSWIYVCMCMCMCSKPRIKLRTLTFRNRDRAKQTWNKHSPKQHEKFVNMRKMLTWAKGAAGVHCVSHSDYSRLLATETAVCVNLGGKEKSDSAAFTQSLCNCTWKAAALTLDNNSVLKENLQK